MTRTVLQTDRLTLRHFCLDDAPFVFALVNEPAFLEFIGDKGVRDLDGAKRYIEDGPIAMLAEHGHSAYVVEHNESHEAIGLCGLFKREFLDIPDLGFAFLEAWSGRGYATESSLGVLRHARDDLDLDTVSAIVNPDNGRSIALLERLGFHRNGITRMPDEDFDVLYFLHSLGRRQ